MPVGPFVTLPVVEEFEIKSDLKFLSEFDLCFYSHGGIFSDGDCGLEFCLWALLSRAVIMGLFLWFVFTLI